MTRLPSIPSVAACVRFGIEMPPLLVAMEDAIGVEPVRAFLVEWGGIQYPITVLPKSTCKHPAATDWLRQELGFGKLLIPMGPTARSARDAHAICVRLIGGASLSVVAREHRVSTRTVTRHKARLAGLGLLPAPKDSAQC